MARRKLPGGIRISDWQHELATLEQRGLRCLRQVQNTPRRAGKAAGREVLRRPRAEREKRMKVAKRDLYVLILPADKTTQTNRPEENFRPVCCIRGILIYNLYLPAERRESIVFVGGVDAYYKALIISFSLEHEHAFTRLGAEKAQVAVTKRGVISSQSYRIAVKLQQLCVPRYARAWRAGSQVLPCPRRPTRRRRRCTAYPQSKT